MIGGIIPNAFAEEQVPNWIKNTAGWWAQDAISEFEFVNAIEFLINEEIIQVSTSDSTSNSKGVPNWIKNTAGWWAQDAISEFEFVNAIEHLVTNGIINVNEKNNFEDFCENKTEITVKLDKKNIEKLCTPFYNLKYENYQIFPKDGTNVIDNHGFRCNANNLDYENNQELCKFPKEKPSDVYRIFLIGGSTMFSSNNDNAHTASAFLEKNISSTIKNKKIQVINAGISGAGSEQEVELVKNKILDFEPDLLVVYDGYNDLSNKVSAENWGQNWIDICKQGNEKEFQTVIFLQPFLGSSYKTFFDFEYNLIRDSTNLDKLEEYQDYRNQLTRLNQHCDGAYDLTDMFDKIPTQVYFDNVHVGSKGDKILADNFFKFILPILDDSQTRIELETGLNSISSINDMSETIIQLNESGYSLENLNFENSKLSDLSLEGQKINNSIFYGSVLKNVNFRNADLSGVVFTGVDLINVDFTNANLTDTVFFKTKMNNVILSTENLDGTSFVKADFTTSIFNSKSIQKTELINSIIPGLNQENNTLVNQQIAYKPIEDRETFVELAVKNDGMIGSIDMFGSKHGYATLFTEKSYVEIQEVGGVGRIHLPFEQVPMTYKIFVCDLNYADSEQYYGCINADESLFKNLPSNFNINDIPPELNEIYLQITNNDEKTIVIFPTISLHAYSEQCIWDYYEPMTDDCKIIQLNNNIVNNYLDIEIWPTEFVQSFSGHLLWNTNFYAFQILQNLNYEILSDLEIEINPNILEEYDKVIVLHNKYVTKKIFDAITNHPKVIYLYPGSLSEEVEINFNKNFITVLSPIKYPEEKIYRNDFLWEFDNSHKEFEDCTVINEPKFEIISNGIMTNCYSENLIRKSVEFHKIIKDY
tara:strand:- start:78 stop:2699 length:2622 start_codon:yes stop_codon:yes gene_type:complete